MKRSGYGAQAVRVYLRGIITASLPWVVWSALGAVSTWACFLLAFACASVLLFLLNQGVAGSNERMDSRKLLVWSVATLLVFALLCVLVTARGKNLSRFVLACAVVFLNELIFRDLFLFDSRIASFIPGFQAKALVQSALWTLLLVLQQFATGGPVEFVLAMAGGYFCLGTALAYLVRKTGAVQLPIILMMALMFMQALGASS